MGNYGTKIRLSKNPLKTDQINMLTSKQIVQIFTKNDNQWRNVAKMCAEKLLHFMSPRTDIKIMRSAGRENYAEIMRNYAELCEIMRNYAELC